MIMAHKFFFSSSFHFIWLKGKCTQHRRSSASCQRGVRVWATKWKKKRTISSGYEILNICFARHDNYFDIVFRHPFCITVSLYDCMQRKVLIDGTKDSFARVHFLCFVLVSWLGKMKTHPDRKKSTSFSSVNDSVRFNAHSQYYLIIRFEASQTAMSKKKKNTENFWVSMKKKTRNNYHFAKGYANEKYELLWCGANPFCTFFTL